MGVLADDLVQEPSVDLVLQVEILPKVGFLVLGALVDASPLREFFFDVLLFVLLDGVVRDDVLLRKVDSPALARPQLVVLLKLRDA